MSICRHTHFSAGIPACAAAMAAMLFAGCGNKNNGNAFDEGFDQLSDGQKVAYVMQNADPDSVARFICDAALGKVPGATIKSLPEATLYAYENYKDEARLQTFSSTYDEYVASRPLDDKMRLMKMAGEIDMQGIGLQLGLEYVDRIRSDHKNAAQVQKEIESFRKACAGDPDTFRRFLTGFKVALEEDHGKDLPEDIYNKFKEYE